MMGNPLFFIYIYINDLPSNISQGTTVRLFLGQLSGILRHHLWRGPVDPSEGPIHFTTGQRIGAWGSTGRTVTSWGSAMKDQENCTMCREISKKCKKQNTWALPSATTWSNAEKTTCTTWDPHYRNGIDWLEMINWRAAHIIKGHSLRDRDVPVLPHLWKIWNGRHWRREGRICASSSCTRL